MERFLKTRLLIILIFGSVAVLWPPYDHPNIVTTVSQLRWSIVSGCVEIIINVHSILVLITQRGPELCVLLLHHFQVIRKTAKSPNVSNNKPIITQCFRNK